jgi:hypothetical protein
MNISNVARKHSNNNIVAWKRPCMAGIDEERHEKDDP